MRTKQRFVFTFNVLAEHFSTASVINLFRHAEVFAALLSTLPAIILFFRNIKGLLATGTVFDILLRHFTILPSGTGPPPLTKYDEF